MRLAISNIAWDIAEDEAVVELLHRLNIDAIDIAPGKYFPEPIRATSKEIEKVRDWWSIRGIEITGMQSLLFGTTGLNMFGSAQAQNAMLQHLETICRIGEYLGATRLVFGSPKNRDRSELTLEQAIHIALPFFRELGDIAYKHGVLICLEPNPTCYGANFMTTSAETADIVRQVNHTAIKMQLDTGALTINGEDIDQLLHANTPLIGHIHASEPNLIPLGDAATNHNAIYEALQKYLPKHVVSVEMVATPNEPHLIAIERALAIAVKNYRQPQGVER